jgi:hypothetical protein
MLHSVIGLSILPAIFVSIGSGFQEWFCFYSKSQYSQTDQQ